MKTSSSDALNCFRCGMPIHGEYKIVQGKFLGPSCYEKYVLRNRIRARVPSAVQTNTEFVTTDLCDTDCLNCIYFNQPKCPQEAAFKGTLGRRR